MKRTENHNICVVAFVLLLMIITGNSLLSQTPCDYDPPGQADNWIFGENAAIKFEDQQAINRESTPFLFGNGMSVMSDSTGELLFYSNGMYVWNRNFELMQNGEGLNGYDGGTQPCIIVPDPVNRDLYYLFTSMANFPIGELGVYYSTIDMAADSGLGAVVQKNTLLLPGPTPEKITAVQHANGKDFWVITHGWGNAGGGSFYSFLVNEQGVDTAYIESNVGTVHSGDFNERNQYGYMKASPDGSKVALAITGRGVVEILDFDNETGLLSNPVSSAEGEYDKAFGIAFSPDSEKIYFTTWKLSAVETSRLYQIDLSGGNYFNNVALIEEYAADTLMAGIQLAADGRIYVAQTIVGATGSGKNSLAVVYNPNRSGNACNFNHLDGFFSRFDLGDGRSRTGLPNFVQSFFNLPPFYPVNVCHKDTTGFRILNPANIDTAVWNFGNSQGSSNSADFLNPSHIYSDTGVYNVRLIETYHGEDFVYSQNIQIHPLPQPEIGFGHDTLYIKPDSWVRLDPGAYDFYYWSDGSTKRYLDVSREGTYWVEVVDSNCCRNKDTVHVAFTKTYIPNAFRPESTVGNNVFKVMGQIRGAVNYRFAIYNRWGQLMFETDSYTEGWDGTFQGQPCPEGMYVWLLTYHLRKGDDELTEQVAEKGTVMLLK